MTAPTAELDPAPWLELLPEGVGDDAYRADVRAELTATARHEKIHTRIGELQAKVLAGLGDPSVDLVDLTGPASQLAAAQSIASVLPPTTPVEYGRHRALALQLPLPSAAALVMPHPPAFCAEVVHHNRIHAPAGELPPIPTDADLDAIRVYEDISAMVAKQWATVEFFRGGLTEHSSMGAYVQAWHDTVNDPGWQALAEAVAELRELLERVDNVRAHQRTGPHRCTHGDVDTMRLQPAALGTAWQYTKAIRDGVLVHITPVVHTVPLPR